MSRKSKAAQFLGEGYSLTVTGRNVHVTEAMKQYAIEKLSKIERISNHIIDVSVTMDIQKMAQRIEVILKVDHFKIVSKATTEDMYASIDMVFDKLQAQLRKYRERIRDHQARGLPVVDMKVNVLRSPDEEDLIEFNSEIEEANQRTVLANYSHPSILTTETMPLKTLTYNEAMMKLDLSDDPFLIFRHEDDMKIKVMYRQEQTGKFAVVEPQIA